jgi:two-component system, cell cycle sensor histidine kinase PleC
MAVSGTSGGLGVSRIMGPATFPSGDALDDIVADPDGAKSDYTINPFFLHFVARDVESRFAIEHLSRALPTIRLFLIAASLLYATFGILDAYIIPDARTDAWLIRYAFVCPFLLGVVSFSFSRAFRRVAQLLLSLCVFVAGFGIVLMVIVALPPGNGLYYAGLIVVVIYGSSLIGLRCTKAAAISLLLLTLYDIVAISINPIPGQLLLNNNFFLVMSVAIGVFSSYVQELQARRDFIANEMLRCEKVRADYLRAEAESASKSKSDFLAMMSHELRTPLNAILGFSEIMQRRMFGPVGSERYASYVDDIHHTARHLLSVITDILDLSKAEVGKITLNEQEVDIFSIVSQCFRLLRERAAENGVRLTLAAPEKDRPIMRVDPTLIKQVFINILGNAIKFTPSGGSVNGLLAINQDGTWVARCVDTGIGIAKADIPRALQPFVQLASALNRKHDGTGLGLPLAKKITELHGGMLSISSELGVGTIVEISLPPERLVSRSTERAGAA